MFASPNRTHVSYRRTLIAALISQTAVVGCYKGARRGEVGQGDGPPWSPEVCAESVSSISLVAPDAQANFKTRPRSILLLPTSVGVFDLETDEPAKDLVPPQIVSQVADSVASKLTQLKYGVHRCGDPGLECGINEMSAQDLAQGFVPDPVSLTPGLSVAETVSLSEAGIVAVAVEIWKGPGAAWDPFSGAIRSGMGSTRIHLGLAHAYDGVLLWQRSVEVGSAPTQNLGLVETALACALLVDFPKNPAPSASGVVR